MLAAVTINAMHAEATASSGGGKLQQECLERKDHPLPSEKITEKQFKHQTGLQPTVMKKS
jgi:hypothetical protein